MDARNEVKAFSEIMEQKLKENDHKHHWTDCENSWLLDQLKEEVEELESIIYNIDNPEKTQRECADVANFAMMIADNVKKLSYAQSEAPTQISDEEIEMEAMAIWVSLIPLNGGQFKKVFSKWYKGILSKAREPKEGWISVEDRLPENDQICDVWHKSEVRLTNIRYLKLTVMNEFVDDAKGVTYDLTGDLHKECMITHWQPLPKPPVKE